MATNKKSEGKVFDYIAAGDEVSGGIKVFTDMAGINLVSAVTGGQGEAAVVGVWTVPKATGDAFTQGQKLGAVGNAAVVATASGAVPLGNAESAAAAGTSEVPVRLNSW